MPRRSRWLLGSLALGLTAAAAFGPASSASEVVSNRDTEVADTLGTFMSSIQFHCGQAFEGRIVANEPAPANDPFAGKRLVMHVLHCSDELRIPFHVGNDRSRTWVIARNGDALRLEHDHRHEDGTEDAVTRYGGDAKLPGTPARQEFPADQRSQDLFLLHGNAAARDNVWAIGIEPGNRFVYELSRPGRLFRVEFDLSRPVDPPPHPWGYELWR